ncbi:MAG: hypothetical protein U0237_17245 [Thermoleophilia bacterium]
MPGTRDEHFLRIAGHTVTVTGESGWIRARWTLSIDGRPVDGAETAGGDLVLRGDLPDGSAVCAEVHQGALGPTRVVVHHGAGTEARFTGFVL